MNHSGFYFWNVNVVSFDSFRTFSSGAMESRLFYQMPQKWVRLSSGGLDEMAAGPREIGTLGKQFKIWIKAQSWCITQTNQEKTECLTNQAIWENTQHLASDVAFKKGFVRGMAFGFVGADILKNARDPMNSGKLGFNEGSGQGLLIYKINSRERTIRHLSR
jgi:hypothetical protein